MITTIIKSIIGPGMAPGIITPPPATTLNTMVTADGQIMLNADGQPMLP